MNRVSLAYRRFSLSDRSEPHVAEKKHRATLIEIRLVHGRRPIPERGVEFLHKWEYDVIPVPSRPLGSTAHREVLHTVACLFRALLHHISPLILDASGAFACLDTSVCQWQYCIIISSFVSSWLLLISELRTRGSLPLSLLLSPISDNALKTRTLTIIWQVCLALQKKLS